MFYKFMKKMNWLCVSLIISSLLSCLGLHFYLRSKVVGYVEWFPFCYACVCVKFISSCVRLLFSRVTSLIPCGFRFVIHW